MYQQRELTQGNQPAWNTLTTEQQRYWHAMACEQQQIRHGLEQTQRQDKHALARKHLYEQLPSLPQVQILQWKQIHEQFTLRNMQLCERHHLAWAQLGQIHACQSSPLSEGELLQRFNELKSHQMQQKVQLTEETFQQFFKLEAAHEQQWQLYGAPHLKP